MVKRHQSDRTDKTRSKGKRHEFPAKRISAVAMQTDDGKLFHCSGGGTVSRKAQSAMVVQQVDELPRQAVMSTSNIRDVM